jgi:hypothetical protein
MRVFQFGPGCRLAVLAILGASSAAALPSPSISQVFGAATVAIGGSMSLTFTVSTNGNTFINLTGVGFTDTLTGLAVAALPGVTNTCGGVVTAVAGSTSIVLAGGSVLAGATCVVSVNITGTAIGSQSSVSSGVSADDFGTAGGSNAAITVTPALPTGDAPASWLLLLTGMLAMMVWNHWQSRLRHRSSAAGV